MSGSPGASSLSDVKTDIAHQLLPLHALPCLPALTLHTARIPSTHHSIGSRYDPVPTNNFMHDRCMNFCAIHHFCDAACHRRPCGCWNAPHRCLSLVTTAAASALHALALLIILYAPAASSEPLTAHLLQHPLAFRPPTFVCYAARYSRTTSQQASTSSKSTVCLHLAQHAFRTPTTIASACLLSEPAIDIPWSFLPSRSLHSLPDSPAAYLFHRGK